MKFKDKVNKKMVRCLKEYNNLQGIDTDLAISRKDYFFNQYHYLMGITDYLEDKEKLILE